MKINRRTLLGTLAATPLAASALRAPAVHAQSATEIVFNYPVAVGGPITRLIDNLCAGFQQENPNIRVRPVYAGSYQDTLTKTLTALRGGEPPHVACLLSADMFTVIDEDAVIAWDDLPGVDRAWISTFYPGFLENSQTGGKTWGIPFQRSTIVLYYNKDAFRAAGLNPDVAPTTWAQQVEFAQRLTKREGNQTSQWGIQIPSSGFPYWLFQGLTTQNDVRLMNPEGTQVFYSDPKVAEALQYWIDLGTRHRVHPPGIVDWGTTPRDFFEKKVAMMWTTTGNLTNVRTNASFPFGVAQLPAGRRPGSPTGGGNIYVFKAANPAQREAAVKFAKYLTTPERAAQWGIDTGYVAVTPAAWETQAMRTYVAGFPAAAVARDQLASAVAELSTHDNQRVTQALNNNLEAALTGRKEAARAMQDAQAEAERLLRPFRR